MVEKEYKVDRVEQFYDYDREFKQIKTFRFFATSKKGAFFTIEVVEKELDKAPILLLERAKVLDSF